MLMLTEVAHALWTLQRSGSLGGLDPQLLLADARELPDLIAPDRDLQLEALALACHLDHPVYNCLYLVLARREAAMLMTADQRLQQLADRVLP
jgi:predicted nucleic acid-binding protein